MEFSWPTVMYDMGFLSSAVQGGESLPRVPCDTSQLPWNGTGRNPSNDLGILFSRGSIRERGCCRPERGAAGPGAQRAASSPSAGSGYWALADANRV